MKPTSKEVINELSKILDATPKEIKGFMKPQEKADELIDKLLQQIYHLHQYPLCVEAATECALIAVNLAIEFADDSELSCYDHSNTLEYLEKVKQEIEKL